MDAATSASRLEGAGPVFPLLMPASWRAPAMATLSRPLLRDARLPELPVVTLAYLVPVVDSPVPNRIFVGMQQARSLGKSVQELYGEARRNVAERQARWSEVAMLGTRLLVCQDDYLAAERVLDSELLGEAHRLLGDDELCIGIPARGQLWAMAMGAGRADPVSLRAFELMMANKFDAARSMPISPRVFAVMDGQLSA